MTGFLPHLSFSIYAFLVVVTCEMEEAVYKKSFQFFVQREAVFCRLPLRLVEIDYDIAKRKDAMRSLKP
jgi:hypothetical protein